MRTTASSMGVLVFCAMAIRYGHNRRRMLTIKVSMMNSLFST